MRRLICLALLFAMLVSPVVAQEGVQKAAKPTPEQLDFFEKRIRPVLVEHCYKCHSEEASGQDELRGGLLLDSRAGI